MVWNFAYLRVVKLHDTNFENNAPHFCIIIYSLRRGMIASCTDSCESNIYIFASVRVGSLEWVEVGSYATVSRKFRREREHREMYFNNKRNDARRMWILWRQWRASQPRFFVENCLPDFVRIRVSASRGDTLGDYARAESQRVATSGEQS